MLIFRKKVFLVVFFLILLNNNFNPIFFFFTNKDCLIRLGVFLTIFEVITNFLSFFF